MKGFPFLHEKFTSYSLLFYKRFDHNVSTFPQIQNGYNFETAESDLLEEISSYLIGTLE